MKRNVLKLLLLICIGVAFLALLMLFAREFPEKEKPEDTAASTTEQTVQTTETQSPTETTVAVLETQPLGASDFVRDGEFMTCTRASYAVGVDVSKYQGQIDWNQVAASGIQFAIIRIGGRGYGQTGNLFADEMAQENYRAAKAAGLKVGAYFFSQAVSVAEAKEEADYALKQIQTWELDLPVVFDWEYISPAARTANTTAETVTACADAFCQRIQSAGKTAMLYIRPETKYLNLEVLDQYPHWIALYSDAMTYAGGFTMWQYTKTGKVPGIQGNVDMNILIF